MKTTLISLLTIFAFGGAAFAAESQKLRKISGNAVFEDHALNQYDDVDNPDQGFEVQVPAGWYFNYSATPDDGDGRKCSVTYDKKTRVFKVEAHDLETDAGGCYAFVIFMNSKTAETKTVSYYIEQTGT